MENLEQYLKFALKIAKKANKIMKKYYSQDAGESYKGDKTIVTLADKEINSYLVEQVKKVFPTHGVDGEEESFGNSKYVWVCDPVDGTAMFARHIPVACFSLALCIDGKPVVGVVDDVFSDCLYTAILGQGAFKNGKRIHVNEINLDDMRSASNFDLYSREYNLDEALIKMKRKTYLTSLGSTVRNSVCVAGGEMEFAIFPSHKNYDIAAVKVIVEEAGGIVTSLDGKEQRYDRKINGAIISNGVVHDEVLSAIRPCLKTSKKTKKEDI